MKRTFKVSTTASPETVYEVSSLEEAVTTGLLRAREDGSDGMVITETKILSYRITFPEPTE